MTVLLVIAALLFAVGVVLMVRGGRGEDRATGGEDRMSAMMTLRGGALLVMLAAVIGVAIMLMRAL